MNKKIAFFAVAAFASTATFGIARAQSEQTNTATAKTIRQENKVQRQQLTTEREQIKSEIQAKRAEFKDAKEKMTEERCKNIETRINTRIGRYDNNQQMLQKVYSNMTARLDRLVARLDAAGADTTKLKTDLATLKTMIEKAYSDNKTFIDGLRTTQEFACGKSEGEFKTKIGEARTVLPAVKKDRQEIKQFFQTIIKADLQAIRKELAAKKTTTTETAPAEEPAVTPTPEIEPVQ